MTDPIQAGADFKLYDNTAIVKINAPKDVVDGPYKVIYKDMDERWAIVALDWDGEPCLGIRWFWDSIGHPQSTGHPTWFIIPDQLARGVLASLPLSTEFAHDVNQFLLGILKGNNF